MPVQVHSFLQQGIEPLLCEVEVDIAETGLPATNIVGLPDAAVKESNDRVRSAVLNSGYPFPETRFLVNLAPADVRKEGPTFDLPMAVGVLLAQNVIGGEVHDRLLLAGELALDGRLRPINGAINLAMLARQLGMDGIVLPAENAEEAATVGGIDVRGASRLRDVVAFLNGAGELPPHPGIDVEAELSSARPEADFGDVRGQEAAKRALAVAAAGAHNGLMIGPAGTGKTMMARALPGILPPMSRDEALEVTRVYSSVGAIPGERPLITQRPVRTPHHTASTAAMIGGGSIPRPGEVSLGHRGVVFLDEMAEFPRTVLETLRQPLEEGAVTIARAQGAVRFPARFMLLGAVNPTPSGEKPRDEAGQREMEKYLAKISGPLIDRIDIHVEVPAVGYNQLTAPARGADTETLRRQVLAARARQADRNGGPARPNSALSGRELDEHARLDEGGRELLRQAMNELGLSARAYDKVRRVARTIADVEEKEGVETHHVAEAVQYRLLDRKL